MVTFGIVGFVLVVVNPLRHRRMLRTLAHALETGERKKPGHPYDMGDGLIGTLQFEPKHPNKVDVHLEVRFEEPRELPFSVTRRRDRDKQMKKLVTGDSYFDGHYFYKGNERALFSMMNAGMRRFLDGHEMKLTREGLRMTLFAGANVGSLKLEDLRDRIREGEEIVRRFLLRGGDVDDEIDNLVKLVAQDPNENVRQKSLVFLLDDITALRSVPSVTQAMESSSYPEVELLAIATGRLDPLPNLLSGPERDTPAFLSAFFRVVANLESEDRTLIALQLVVDPKVAHSALRLLESVEDAQVVPHLITAYPAAANRLDILRYLGRRVDARVQAFLLERLEADTWEERQIAVKSLGVGGSFTAIEPLAKARDVARQGMKRDIDQAIRKIQAREGAGEGGWISLEGSESSTGYLSLEDSISGQLSLDQNDPGHR
ncbi:HEAT repeat domain-containing protein [Sulfidibacter corallicola]|uniref:HEAT repeat domain-containing protein n=1 Tax=Sulfidibacter corallicola TaxID=2818388 RepID=A0A8A4TJT0_SULCO|nr:HEAT repeat domain-containing protein [Sulfidibacter corallicola]QTD49454.1 HEAT repeat domain-containing protein [Sulfidibacter corallicola]